MISSFKVCDEKSYHLLGISADDKGCSTRNIQDPPCNVIGGPKVDGETSRFTSCQWPDTIGQMNWPL